MLSRAFASAMFLIGVSEPHFALAVEASGRTAAVVPAAAASGTGGSRTLVVDGPVFMGDVVKTDTGGSAQIKFVDDTKLVVGPNSQVTIDSFVFQSKTTAKSFSINAVEGTFRFITGASAKNVYSIKTPSATIGVRGTEFDFAVDGEGTHVGLWGGALRLCTTGQPQRCTEISGACSVVIVTPVKQINRVNNVYERTAIMEALFPFAFRQNRLQVDFRVESGSCNIQNYDPAPPPSGDDDTPPSSGDTYDGGYYN